MKNFETKISDIESVIANKISEKYMIEISDTMGHMTGDDGAIVHSGVWKALKDKKGNLIKIPVGIKKNWP